MTKPVVDASLVVHSLGEWLVFDGPLFGKLAAGLVRAIDRGEIPHGHCLPSERTLAQRLSVSRGTVVAAYAAVGERGLVERRRGSGTWVTATPAAPVVDMQDHAAALRSRRLTARSIPVGDALVDLGVSILLDTGRLPDSALHLDRPALERAARGHGYLPLGIPDLRRRIAELHTTSGLPTTPEQIAVTNGAQHAITRAARLLVRPGDQVLVETPTYPGAIDAFSRSGASLATVSTDGAGARTDDIGRSAARARLAYVMPSFHNPTGSVMPEGRRRELAALADGEDDLWLIEDNSLEHLWYQQPPPPPVAAFARGDRVISIGSLSKLFWGGLRIGWIRAQPTVINRIARLRASDDFGPATPSQVIALGALSDVETVAEECRRVFAERRDLAMGLLEHRLPEWDCTAPAGGLSLWARLPAGTADALAPIAGRHGVTFLPGGAASADDAHPEWLRLSFAETPDRLAEGIRRLTHAWADYHPTADVVGTVTSLG